MAARKDKSNTAGQFQKGDPRATDCQLLSAASRSANADTHAKAKSLITGEDRETWITVLNAAAKKGDLNALKLLLQILKELPALGQTIDLHTEAMSDEDKALLKAVRERYDNA
jgi:hypothetical protein